MATLKQQTSFGPGIYRGHVFSVDRLKAFVDGTNAAIKAGVPIPLLKRHAPINASDDDTVQFAKEEGSGWIKEVFIDSKGNIGFEADNVPTEDAEKATQGTLKFTSPEFRPHYECEKAGVYSGPVIRHFAFTPTPGNPHQGAVEVLAMSESCIQLSEADYQGPIQHAELYPADVPSINDLQDSQYKDKGVKYPKHTDDAADDEDHDVNNELGEGSEGNSVDEEELVDGETKPKKKKGTTNKGEDVDHEQEMDKGANKDVDTQHSEAVHGRFHAPDDSRANHADYNHEAFKKHVKSVGGEHGATAKGGAFSFSVPKARVKEFHKRTKHFFTEGRHFSMDSQHAEKNSDGFGKLPNGSNTSVSVTHFSEPKNDEPNAPAKQPPNDPNLEVMENPEAPIENAPPENPDMPPKATDKTKLSAIIAGLNQLGVVVPSDWDPCKDGSMDILLGCLNTHIKTEQDAEVEENAGQEEDVESPKDAPMPFSEKDDGDEGEYHGSSNHARTFQNIVHDHGGDSTIWRGMGRNPGKSFRVPKDQHENFHKAVASKIPHYKHGTHYTLGTSQHTEETELQFTEDELKAMPAKARKVIEAGQVALKAEREARIKAEQEAIAFAEQEKLTKAMAAKGKAIAEVTASVIPPALKKQLLGDYQNVQFEEGNDQPLYTGEQVAKMVANCIPPTLQFLEEQTNEGVKPAVSIKVGVDGNGQPIYKQVKDAEQFFEDSPSEFVMTKERANEIANATTARIQTHHHNVHTFTPTVPLSQMVASENQRVPNNVMNQ